MKNNLVIIAGGGTGGHIYPGLAVAEEVKKLGFRVHFVGGSKGLETKIVPAAGYELTQLPVQGLNRVGLLQTLKSLFLLPVSLFKSALLVLKLKPAFVLGVGGYASGPFLLMASLLGFRTAIWEINAQPGITNRILSKFVSDIWIVFKEAGIHFPSKKQRFVGMPVRESIKPLLVSEGHSRSTEKFKILVFGGSQGARGINNCVRDLILKNPSWLSDCQIRLQTGSLDFATIENSLKGISNVEVKEYLKTIDQDYRWANLIVCRAGASTLAELAAAKKAAILIPFPFAADDHQRKNAEALAVQGAARCIVQKDLTPERLEKEILDFKNNPKLIEDLESSIAKIHRPGAAALMASQIKESCL